MKTLVINGANAPGTKTGKGANMAKPKKNVSMEKAKERGILHLKGLKPKPIFKDAITGQVGMLCAQFAVKKFGKTKKSYWTPFWDWSDYMWGIGGAYVGAAIGGVAMPGKVKNMASMGVGCIFNKMLHDKVIQKEKFLQDNLGGFNSLSAKYNMNQLNPPASQGMRKFDMYGNPLQGPIVQESYNMGGPVVPVGTMGAPPSRFTTRTDLGRGGRTGFNYADAFIRN